MTQDHKQVLTRANAAMSRGDVEGFLEHCTEDTEWRMLGDRTLKGKAAVREYLAASYPLPPPTVAISLVGTI